VTRVAIVGIGRMGRRHIPAARAIGLEIVGICDQSCEALAAAEQNEGIPSHYLYVDVRELLEVRRPDCVVIATTAPSHCEITAAAVVSGVRFILCEKPMATSL
jgi:predicted dehydrogenase